MSTSSRNGHSNLLPIYTSDDTPHGSDTASSLPTSATDPSVHTHINKLPTGLELTLHTHGLNSSTLSSIRDELVTIAHQVGKMMQTASSTLHPTSHVKKNSSDLVTDTDRAIEKVVQAHLDSLYPAMQFLGEESFQEGTRLSTAPTFICDPIDGTLNFVHGFPNTAVSLALVVDKKPVVGVVYNPFRGDCYHGVRGQGAFLTSAAGVTQALPLRNPPAALRSLSQTLVALEWGSERAGPNWDLRTSMATSLLSSRATGGAMIHSLRSSGSAALDFCYVAAGQLDLFWEGGCWAWDVAGGWLVLEEAGGMVASANPGDWAPEVEGRLYLAVRPAEKAEQESVVKEIWALMGKRRFVF